MRLHCSNPARTLSIVALAAGCLLSCRLVADPGDPLEALALSERADEEIRIAETNDAWQVDTAIWSGILRAQEQMHESRQEEHWGDVSDRSVAIIGDVYALLHGLENEALASQRNVNESMETLENLGGVTHALARWAQCQQAASEVAEAIDARSYRQAIERANAAMPLIDETLLETRRSIAEQGITDLESMIAEVYTHGGDFRLAIRVRDLSEQFEDMLTLFHAQECDEVMTMIRVMRPIAQRMVVDAYRSEAEELLALRRQELARLSENAAGRLPPDLLAEMETQISEAQRLLDEGEAVVAALGDDPSAVRRLLDEARPPLAASVEASVRAGEEIDGLASRIAD